MSRSSTLTKPSALQFHVRSGPAHGGERKGEFERGLAQAGEAAGDAGVACIHVDAQEVGTALWRFMAQARRPLRWLPVGDARIGEAARDQHGRIVAPRDLV